MCIPNSNSLKQEPFDWPARVRNEISAVRSVNGREAKPKQTDTGCHSERSEESQRRDCFSRHKVSGSQ